MKKSLIGTLIPMLPVLLGFYLPVVLVALDDGFLTGSGAPMAAGDFSVILTTIRLAAIAALVATSLGWFDAVVLAGTRGVGRRIIWTLLLASFLIPPAALASAVQACLGSSTLRATVRDEIGAVTMLAIRWAPVAAAMLLGAASLWPRGQERALRGLPPMLSLATRARGLAPMALRCFGLLFLLLLPAAELPSYAGVETVSQRILSRLTVGDAAAGWRLAAILGIVALPSLYLLFPGVADPQQNRTGCGAEGLPRWKWADRWLWFRVLPAAALLIILSVTSWPRASQWSAVSDELVGASVSVALEFPRVCVASVVAILCGWRLAEAGSRIGLILLSIPTLLPGSLGALALIQVVRPLLPVWLDDVPFLLTIAQCCKLGALGAAAGLVATRVFPRSEADSAAMIDPFTARWKIRFPRALGVLIPAAVVGIAMALGEVESTLLLAPPGHPSTALELHQMLHFRNDEQAARLAMVLAMVGAMLAVVVAPRGGKGD